MAANIKSSDTSDRELVISREYNAPLTLVWKAWTEPQHLAQWWGPNGFSITTYEINFKPKGIWRFTMHGPDGRDYKNRVNYIEIVPLKRLVYAHGGEEGDADIQFHVTVTFTEKAGKTTVTMQSVFPTKEQFDKVVREHGAIEGAKQHLENLAEHLPTMGNAKAALPEKAFVYSRELNAPRALVWKAWTEGERLAHWWGPKGMKVEVLKAEVRPGGKFHYSMETPDGQKMWGVFNYRELNPTERIVWVNSFADAKGAITRAPFSPLIPLEMHNTVLLEEMGSKTQITLRSAPINATPEERAFFEGMFKSMEGGFGGTFDQLAAYLAKAPECNPEMPVYVPTTKNSGTFKLELRGEREIYMERQFDAPKRLVFLAHSKAEHMRNWWGPREFKTTFCELDFRVGGRWRIAHKGPDGVEYAFHGEYREIVKDERITWTFVFENMPGVEAENVAIETVTLEEKNGKTILRARSIAPSKEARDGMAQSGMEWGARQTYDRLDELVAKLK
jgi:uncharacterized protein YndB with AHSA1/START domain